MNIKRIFYYYWESAKQYKWHFFALLFIYSIAIISSNVIGPLIFKDIIDIISLNDYLSVIKEDIFKLFFFFVLNVLVYNIFYRTGDFLITHIEAIGMRDIANMTFKKLSNHSYNFYTNTFAGSLVAKSRRFVSSFEGIIDRIALDFLFIFIKIISIFVVLFIQMPIVGIAFFVWLVVYCIILYFFIRIKIRLDIVNSEADSNVTAVLADTISNVLNIKIFSSGKRERNYLKEIIQKQYKARSKSWNFSNYQLLIQGLMIGFLQVMIIYLSINLWLKGEITAGTVVLVQTYTILLFDSLWNLSRSVGKFITNLSDAKEMVDIFDKPIDILDPENPEQLKVNFGEIEFKNVSFEYNNNNEVFTNFNLKIKAGEKIGLVGHSGSGKTTITKMLLRFVDIKEGEILIDGQNIKNITQDDLRSVISYVLQEPILFHRSIAENIGYSKENATHEEIVESSKKAHADEFISKLQNGYNTLVGERGIKLSGGERQRVAIARAMLKNAPILVLDEATSALDSISESYIKEALNILMKDKTAIVIAHRLSTIAKMDRIIVLDNGIILEEGTHLELLDKDGMYTKLWNHQTGFLNEE